MVLGFRPGGALNPRPGSPGNTSRPAPPTAPCALNARPDALGRRPGAGSAKAARRVRVDRPPFLGLPGQFVEQVRRVVRRFTRRRGCDPPEAGSRCQRYARRQPDEAAPRGKAAAQSTGNPRVQRAPSEPSIVARSDSPRRSEASFSRSRSSSVPSKARPRLLPRAPDASRSPERPRALPRSRPITHRRTARSPVGVSPPILRAERAAVDRGAGHGGNQRDRGGGRFPRSVSAATNSIRSGSICGP